MIENHKVDFESEHKDEDREDDETDNPSEPVAGLVALKKR